MMLRAAASTSTRASTSALLCSECLQCISLSSSTIRAQSTSAFGSRAATSSPSSNAGNSNDYAIPYDRSTSSSSSSSRTSYNGTRNAQSSGIRRDMRLSGKDWKSASPNSSSRYNGQQQQSQYQDRSSQYDRSSSQGSSSTYRAGMRRDAPPTRRDDTSQRSSSSSSGPSSSSRHTSSNSQSTTTTYASSIPGQYSSNSSNSTPSRIPSGHRGNLRSRSPTQSTTTSSAAAGTRSEPPATDKVVARQVNFGHGSALAAFASMKKAKQEQAQAQAQARASSPSPSSVSVSASPAMARRRPDVPLQRKTPLIANRRRPRIPKKTVEIPPTVSVNALSQILGLKLRRLQFQMEKMGITDTRADKLLPAEDASLIAGELGYQADVVDAETGFDIYASPPHENPSSLALRPPIVTIMGHVDHGKTSLLDALRSTKVAAGEAGGITQHIGAFNVPLSSLLTSSDPSSNAASTPSDDVQGSITFLDTPGHAAFAAMRSRGASVTDVAVLVVAADDGVKPQTKEVIDLVKNEDVGLVIAITKCDKPGIDIARVHAELFENGLEVEAIGGDIPCVEVSAHSKKGLDDLVETINVVAEVRDLRAEVEGIPSEGRIIESRIDKGKGNVTTLIVTRGTLKVGSLIIAGKAFGRVRQLLSGEGEILQEAKPGTPVEVTGWKILPEAGDQVLEATSEEDAKKAIETRKRREERRKEMGDLEAINEKRRIMSDANILRKKMQDQARKSGQDPNAIAGSAAFALGGDDENEGVKILNLIIKSDFNGTEEAVSNALAEIGNSEARVKIVETGVGDITDGDLALAKAVDGVIIGFNVKASRQILSTAQQLQIPILQNNVIYRLIDEVKERVISLLPKLYDQRVVGEAIIQQIFKYTVKGSGTKSIAGCRVTNGQLNKKTKVRVMRDGEIIFDGAMDSLKHHKEEVDEMRKGSDCGVVLDGFEGFAVEDTLQCYEETERKRSL